MKFSPYIEGQIKFETKAESKYPAVAVASIIARYSFLTKIRLNDTKAPFDIV